MKEYEIYMYDLNENARERITEWLEENGDEGNYDTFPLAVIVRG